MILIAMLGSLSLAVACSRDSGSGDGQSPGPPEYDADRCEQNDDWTTCYVITPDVTPLASFVETGLNLHSPSDEDFFCFSTSEGQYNTIGIGFEHYKGNIDLQLLDANGVLLYESAGTEDFERIIWPAGDYIVRVFSPEGATNEYEIHIGSFM